MEIINHQFKTKSLLKKRNKTTEIILHCSATPEGKDFTVDQIDSWHKQRDFSCIGYQFVIYRDGSVHRGRPEDCVGAHCTGHNSNSIGVCYIGGLTSDGKNAKDTRTVEQKKALFELCYYLMGKYNITMNNIHGHYEYAKKACPSFDVNKFRFEYLDWVNDK